LLERRQTFREAESKRDGSNAQIGVAKAAFFPSLSSQDWWTRKQRSAAFLQQPSQTWSAGFNITQPIFEGGALRSQLRLAVRSGRKVYFLRTNRAGRVQQVSNGLVAISEGSRVREQQELLVQAAERSDGSP